MDRHQQGDRNDCLIEFLTVICPVSVPRDGTQLLPRDSTIPLHCTLSNEAMITAALEYATPKNVNVQRRKWPKKFGSSSDRSNY